MRHLLFGILTLLILCVSCKKDQLNPFEQKTESSSSDEKDSLIIDYLEMMNAHRVSRGLRTLDLIDSLSEIARTHSFNMARGKVSFGHTGFNQRCDQARDVMGSGNLCGEIVARGQDSARKVLDSWLASSGHRQKIEESRFTHTGVAMVKDSEGKYYWTQIFLEVKN